MLLVNVSFVLIGQQESRHTRIVIFNNIGQKETVRIDENVSIVLGTNVKPEYTYLAYSSGKSPGEYIVELKSNEFLLKKISELRNSLNSMKKVIPLGTKIPLLAENSKNQSNAPNKSNSQFQIEEKPQITRKLSVKDTLSKKIENMIAKQRFTNNDYSVFNIPEYQSYIETVQSLVNKSSTSIEDNNSTISKNKKHIDTIREKIAKINETGQNVESLDNLGQEIDSLLTFNYELLLMNKSLSDSKSNLEKELKLKIIIYNYLVRFVIGLIVVIALIFIIIIVLYRSYRQKKKFNVQLENINKVLENTNHELYISNQQLLEQNREIQEHHDQLFELNNEKEKLLSIIKNELLSASEYVISLIPKPKVYKTIQTDWIFIPSDDLGGDAFGYNWIDENNFAVYLLDVSGHGIGSALHSVQVLNTLQNRTLPNIDFTKPNEVLNALNNIFQMRMHKDVYFTLWYGVYNKADRKLKYASAGHPPMLLSENGSGVKLLESQNIWIGAKPNVEFKYDELTICNPATLFLFSDGVYEIRKTDSKMYTFDEFSVQIINSIEKDNRNLSYLYDYAKQISGKSTLNDDFSILKIKFE